jgi:hypothetical protein
MSKTTNRTRAFIYDVFAKCESNENFSFNKLIKHHQIGWMAYEALKKSGRVFMTKPYNWVGIPPSEDVVCEIENIRVQLQKEHNQKWNPDFQKPIDNTNQINVKDLIEQNEKLINFIKTLHP